MLDVSRNRVYSLQTLFTVVDLMAELRLNRLELYFENVFAYAAHPQVWANISPYTAEDIAALEAYCAERAIALVPNQNTLGHFERWFRHPDYLRYAELPQGGARTPWGSIQTIPTGLATGDPATRAFAQGLLEELLPCFPRATTANLGGDEVFDLGLGRSQGGDKATLFLEHLQAMAATAERFGKVPELWADMLLRHPEILERAHDALPTATWVLWGYEATDPLAANAERLRAHGLNFMVAPGTSSWRSFCGRTSNMLANIQAAAQIPSAGLLLCDWGDSGHWQPLVVSLPAIVWAAALAWDPTASRDVIAPTVDKLTHVPGLGDFLLRLGDTYRTAEAEAGNATRLFQAYNLPLAQAPAFNPAALEQTARALESLAKEGAQLGDSLWAQEARFALELQQLAVARAQGRPNLHPTRAALAERLEHLWLARGPRAQLDASLRDFLAPDLP